MADSNPEQQNDKIRHTVSFTHKQLGISGGILAAIAMVSQLKGVFTPVEKSEAQEQRISELRLDISSTRNELTETIRRGNDKIIDRIRESEERSSKNSESHDRRIESLEASLRIPRARKEN